MEASSIPISANGVSASSPQKGLLRFDIIDEDGWQWTVLHLNKQTREIEVLELTEDARAAVNDKRNRFSWTGDGRRDIEDKRVHFECQDDAVVQPSDMLI